MTASPGSWLREARRRGVLRAAGLYLAGAWVAIEVVATTIPLLDGPAWIPRLVLVLALLGFPVAITLAWVFDFTRHGIRRTPGQAGPGSRPGWRSLAVGVVVLLVTGAAAQATYSRVSGANVERSVAVLPLANLSGADDSEFFSDGLTEEILTTLAQIQDLRVISRSSAMAYKDTGLAVRQIGRELGAEHVLTGSVRRDGERIRVSVQLVHASTDRNVWAQHYDRDLADIFQVQSDIAHQITAALEARLSRSERRRLDTQPTWSPEAYEYYLRALDYGRRGHPDALAIAIEFLNSAIALDAGFAAAHAQLATGHILRVNRFGDDRRWLDSAVVAARQAIDLDEGLVAGHVALGTALTLVARYDEARSSLERALRLGPNDAGALGAIAILSGITGDIPSAIRHFRDALRLDPGQAANHRGNLSFGYALLGMTAESDAELEAGAAVQPDFPGLRIIGVHNALLRGDVTAAIEHGEELLSRFPAVPAALTYAAAAHLFAGDRARARTYLEEAYRISPGSRALHDTRVALGALLWSDGEIERARALFTEFDADPRSDLGDPAVLYDQAVRAATANDIDQAVRWLERATAAGFIQPGIARRDPLLAPVPADPRARALLTVCRFKDTEPAQLAVSLANSSGSPLRVLVRKIRPQ